MKLEAHEPPFPPIPPNFYYVDDSRFTIFFANTGAFNTCNTICANTIYGNCDDSVQPNTVNSQTEMNNLVASINGFNFVCQAFSVTSSTTSPSARVSGTCIYRDSPSPYSFNCADSLASGIDRYAFCPCIFTSPPFLPPSPPLSPPSSPPPSPSWPSCHPRHSGP